jgi:hypothetical protein
LPGARVTRGPAVAPAPLFRSRALTCVVGRVFKSAYGLVSHYVEHLAIFFDIGFVAGTAAKARQPSGREDSGDKRAGRVHFISLRLRLSK